MDKEKAQRSIESEFMSHNFFYCFISCAFKAVWYPSEVASELNFVELSLTTYLLMACSDNNYKIIIKAGFY